MRTIGHHKQYSHSLSLVHLASNYSFCIFQTYGLSQKEFLYNQLAITDVKSFKTAIMCLKWILGLFHMLICDLNSESYVKTGQLHIAPLTELTSSWCNSGPARSSILVVCGSLSEKFSLLQETTAWVSSNDRSPFLQANIHARIQHIQQC